MATATTASVEDRETVGDLLARLGDIPPERVLLHPPPGTATEEDLVALLEAPNKRLCELVDGTLVEKPMGIQESVLAGVIVYYLWCYLDKHPLGIVTTPDGPIRLRLGLVRIPDVSFISWKRLRMTQMPRVAVSPAIPDLAVEVLSESNTRKEIEGKLGEYFKAGVRLAWIVDPETETAEVYRSPSKKRPIARNGVLEGGKVLPGFRLPLKKLFGLARKRR